MVCHAELCLPQISWHAKEPIQSIDASAAAGLIATAANDNEVRLWRLHAADAAPLFLQSLQGHSKACAQLPHILFTNIDCAVPNPAPSMARLSTSCASAPSASQLRQQAMMH